ncbi:hypothetical protein J6590_056052 [Homalodisca vitripennis]|nr:hypothetical protein J6590_056052 [Homalodisca vitripennis]
MDRKATRHRQVPGDRQKDRHSEVDMQTGTGSQTDRLVQADRHRHALAVRWSKVRTRGNKWKEISEHVP